MPGVEAKLQSEIIGWLKINGVYVIKPRSGPGVPHGCPDIIGLYKDRWLTIEVKTDATSKFQPLQKDTLARLKAGNRFVYVVYPENWAETKKDLQDLFF